MWFLRLHQLRTASLGHRGGNGLLEQRCWLAERVQGRSSRKLRRYERKRRQTSADLGGVVRAVREGAAQVWRGVEGVALLSRAGLQDGVLLQRRVGVRAPQHFLLTAVALQAGAACARKTHKQQAVGL